MFSFVLPFLIPSLDDANLDEASANALNAYNQICFDSYLKSIELNDVKKEIDDKKKELDGMTTQIKSAIKAGNTIVKTIVQAQHALFVRQHLEKKRKLNNELREDSTRVEQMKGEKKQLETQIESLEVDLQAGFKKKMEYAQVNAEVCTESVRLEQIRDDMRRVTEQATSIKTELMILLKMQAWEKGEARWRAKEAGAGGDINSIPPTETPMETGAAGAGSKRQRDDPQ
jgi:hypothetical protein